MLCNCLLPPRSRSRSSAPLLPPALLYGPLFPRIVSARRNSYASMANSWNSFRNRTSYSLHFHELFSVPSTPWTLFLRTLFYFTSFSHELCYSTYENALHSVDHFISYLLFWEKNSDTLLMVFPVARLSIAMCR